MLKKRIVVASFVLLFLVSFINLAVSVNAKSSVIHVYEGQSIQDAINAANDGYKIIVHEGTYKQQFGVYKRLEIIGLGAIIDLEETGLNMAISVDASGVTISGFTIRNIPEQLSGAAIVCGEFSGVLIANNIIQSGFYGILLYPNNIGIPDNPSNIEIRDNWISAVAPIHIVNAPNVVIKNNVVSAHKSEVEPSWLGAGIAMYEGLSSGLIEGNIINSEYWGMNIGGVSNVEVRSNKVYTSYYGILAYNAPNVVIKKNVVSAQATTTLPQPNGIILTGAFSGGSIKNNEINSEYVGISTDGQSDIEICDNKVDASYYGIDARNAPNVVIKKNVVTVHNLDQSTDPPWPEEGIAVTGSLSTGLIEGNIINSKYRGIWVRPLGDRMRDIKIRKNTITAITSIAVNKAQNVIIENNVVHSSDVGIVHTDAIDATLIDNEVYISKGAQGLSPPYWIGILLTGEGGNIASNKVSGNFELGISIGNPSLQAIISTDNTVLKNSITGGTTSNDIGVYLDTITSANSVMKNKISGVDTPIDDLGTGNIIKP
jgi:parallel beta-helix repeat protein